MGGITRQKLPCGGRESDVGVQRAAAGLPPRAGHLPDGGVHAAVIKLLVVELSEEREQHLDASYGVDGAVDGVRDDGLHVLQGGWGGHISVSE